MKVTKYTSPALKRMGNLRTLTQLCPIESSLGKKKKRR